MNKNCFLLLLFALVTIGSYADEYTNLIVSMNDGSTTNFRLTEQPKITFSGELMSVVSATSFIEFKRKDVKNYRFAVLPTSIDNVDSESQIEIIGNTIVISNVPEDTDINVYTTNGTLVFSTTPVNGVCNIFLDNYPHGIYIISYNNTIFKILNK